MNKFFKATMFAAAFTLAACGGQVRAAPLAGVVVNASSTVSYGTDTVRVFKKKTDSGNQVEVLYAGGNVKYVDDNAAWSKHGEFVTKTAGRSQPVGDAKSTYVVTSASNGVQCVASKSSVSFPDLYSPVEFADGCAFWQTTK